MIVKSKLKYLAALLLIWGIVACSEDSGSDDSSTDNAAVCSEVNFRYETATASYERNSNVLNRLLRDKPVDGWTFFISGSLVNGLTFSRDTGDISGSPLVSGFAQEYTVIAANETSQCRVPLKIGVTGFWSYYPEDYQNAYNAENSFNAAMNNQGDTILYAYSDPFIQYYTDSIGGGVSEWHERFSTGESHMGLSEEGDRYDLKINKKGEVIACNKAANLDIDYSNQIYCKMMNKGSMDRFRWSELWFKAIGGKVKGDINDSSEIYIAATFPSYEGIHSAGIFKLVDHDNSPDTSLRFYTLDNAQDASLDNYIISEPSISVSAGIDIDLNDNGDFVSAWAQTDGAEVRIHIFEYINGLKQPITAIAGSLDPTSAAEVALSNNGDAIVVWVQDNKVYKAEKRHGVWSGASQVSASVGFSIQETNPQVAIANNGDAIITWEHFDNATMGAFKQVRVSQYQDQSWGDATVLSDHSGGAAYHSLYMSENGTIVVAWVQAIENNPPVSNQYVYLRRFINNAWEITFNASIESADSANPVMFSTESLAPGVAINDFGHTVVIWKYPYSSGGTPSYRMVRREFR